MSLNTRNLSDLEEIERFEQAIATFNAGGIDPDRFTAIRLQQGVYGQRQQGVNMLRIKIPGGRLTAVQLDAIADVAGEFSQHQIAHLTTRQSIQIHYIPLVQMPDAMRRLAKVGLTTREACGNTIRNMTACPLAGVCPKEHVDVSRHVDGATVHFLRNPLNQQLPRKFKISFSGCEADCAQSLLHDCGVIAVTKDGQHGFRIRAGGGLGHKPRESIVVEEFIPERELLYAMEALVTLHNKYSDRTKRAKSRIKFLVERFGAEGFIEKYREEFERTRQALADQPWPQGEWRTPSGTEAPGQGAPRKIFAQRQSGLFVFPIALPIGDVRAEQLRGIAQVLQEQGLDEIHATQDQNFAVLNVPQAKVAALRSGIAGLGLTEPKIGDNVVACPGTSTCRLGITSSTVLGPLLSGGKADLHIRVSGCHNGCAQPETGDIGIYGEGKRLHGKLVPHYQMYFAGKGTSGGALALKGPSLPVARVKQAIERVQVAHLASGESSFFVWARKQEADYFRTLLADLAEVKAEELESVMRDYGDKADFRVLQLGGGECAGASQVLIGANFFEAAHEREYRNALVFQRKYSEAAQCNESILRLLGSGVAQLLGGARQDDLAKLAEQLNLLAPEEIAAEFAHAALELAGSEEIDNDALAAASAKVDAWTVKVAAFAAEKDGQLDLKEALPK
ncbi:nitrite/sulfite reductase [Sideroxydans lithotrophicus]|uniref:Sulfite reductase (Ferredoxin) n=1 Tax=Sideroxydans lithotrophicus (strain ES-1) TaxID=580332 RepID=D5CQN4_SIDLE|nr:nitrite/sulfite reductase [Sideroxydans lithotrophicus]ADE11270.1 Sulfite reductase (ferredoxin) [Sideroxydans lithotrophicus ES-1]